MAEEFDGEDLVGDEEDESSDLLDNRSERLDLKTHNLIDQNLCGVVEDLQDGYAKIRLITTEAMAVDKKGLVHTGFVFSAANFAAMAAVNKPNVVLAVARCNFLAPLKVEDEVIFEASALQTTTRKRNIMVVGSMNDVKVFEGEFAAVVLEKHVLSLHLMSE
ncbi:MAG: hotdog domain-containing protein [Campylobacterales bacterium]